MGMLKIDSLVAIVEYEDYEGIEKFHYTVTGSVQFVRCRERGCIWTLSMCTQFPVACVIPKQGVPSYTPVRGSPASDGTYVTYT